MMTFTKAALIADKLNLGPHWVYDTDVLAKEFPNGLTEFRDPLSPYHPNRKAGGHTHIGDQTLYLAECLELNESYEFLQWKAYWMEKMSSYDGYVDAATKKTLATDASSPSDSTEISGVCRMVPLLDLGLSLAETITAAQSQASLTHAGSVIPEATEFFLRLIYALKSGVNMAEALDKAALEGTYSALKVSEELARARAADQNNHRAVAKDFGQGCKMEGAFPLTLYYALNFSGKELISANALGGGDNTSRALILSALIVAQDGGACFTDFSSEADFFPLKR